MSDFAEFERKTKNKPRHDEDSEVAHFSGTQPAFSPPEGGAPDDNGVERWGAEQHIITHLNAHLPELYEFFLLGENERYIRVGDLRALQLAIHQFLKKIKAGEGNALPKDIAKTLPAPGHYKAPDSVYNPFGAFLGKYIDFRMRHGYGENGSLPRILLEANKQRQGGGDERYQRVAQINLLASRLRGYIARTVELLERASQMDLSPWLERVKSMRNVMENQLPSTTLGKQLPFSPARYDDSPNNKYDPENLVFLKLNHLVHAQLQDAKARGEKEHGLANESAPEQNMLLSALSALFTPGEEDLDVAGDAGDNGSIRADTGATSMSGALALILQGITLTRKEAGELSPPAAANKRGEGSNQEDSQLVTLIVDSCERLTPIVSALQETMKLASPSQKELRVTPEKSKTERIKKAYAVHQLADYSRLLHLPRLLEAAPMRLRRKANQPLARLNSLTPEEQTAVLLAGWIVKDKLQQTRANLLKIGQATQPLLAAWKHAEALEQLLGTRSIPELDNKLEATRSVWEAAKKKESETLKAFIADKMVLSHQDACMNVKREIEDIIRGTAGGKELHDILTDFIGELEVEIDFLASVEKQMENIPSQANKTEADRTLLPKYIQALGRELQEHGSALNEEMSRLAGREPGSFSRTGMLAKGLAGLQLEWKREWLQNTPAADPGAAGQRYDAAFDKIFGGYAPLLAKAHDGGGKMLLQRVRTERVHAATGNTLYPTTTPELLSRQKSVGDMLKSWAIRRVVKKGLYAAFGSVSFLPSLMALPLRIVIQCMITGAIVTYTLHKGREAVKLGEGSVELETDQYRRNAFEQVAIKVVLGAVPGFSEAMGAAFLGGEIYKGKFKEAAAGMAKEVSTELPYIGARGVVRKGASAAWELWQEHQFEKEFQRFFDDLGPVKQALPSATQELLGMDDRELKPLAIRLMNTGKLSRVRMGRSKTGKSYYDLKTRTVMLREGATDQEKLHEIAHALSAHQLRYAQDRDVPKRLKKEGKPAELKAHRVLRRQVKRLDRLRQRARQAYKQAGGKNATTLYYLSNLDEFVAGLYSGDSEFTHFLGSIDERGRSLLTQAIALLCLLLALDAERDSALTRAMGLSEKMMGTPLAEGEGSDEGKLFQMTIDPLNMTQRYYNRKTAPATSSTIPLPVTTSVPKQAFARDNPMSLSNTTMPSGAARASLVSGLAEMSRDKRDEWFQESKLNADSKKDLGIYLAENHYIYDHMVSGREYFAWVQSFKKWRNNFQAENRIVGVLRLPQSVLSGNFPAGKGLKFILKNESGDVVFEKIYYPHAGSESSGTWQGDILSQIEGDMLLQDEHNRISVSYIHRYAYTNPVLRSGASNDVPNVFVADVNSQVKSADFQIVNEGANLLSKPDPDEGSPYHDSHIVPNSHSSVINQNVAVDPVMTRPVPEITSADIRGAAGENKPDIFINTQSYLDDVIIGEARKQGLNYSRSDLNTKVKVSFVTSTLAEDVTGPPVEYTLRNILLGNFYRDEDPGILTDKQVSGIQGMPTLTAGKINLIRDNIASTMKLKIAEQSELFSFQKNSQLAYQNRLNAMLLHIAAEQPGAVFNEFINPYLKDQTTLKTLSITSPTHAVSIGKVNVAWGSQHQKYAIPGVVVLERIDGTKLLISLKTNKYMFFNPVYLNNKEALSAFILPHLSDFNKQKIKEGQYKNNWLVEIESPTSEIAIIAQYQSGRVTDKFVNQAIWEELRKREVNLISDNINYTVYTTKEHTTVQRTEYFKSLMQAGAFAAGLIAMGSTGGLHAAALTFGLGFEGAETAAALLQMDNADRGDSYLSAAEDALLGGLLSVFFGVNDAASLLSAAAKNAPAFRLAAEQARNFIGRLKSGRDGAEKLLENLSKFSGNPRMKAKYLAEVFQLSVGGDTVAETVLGIQFRSGILNKNQYDELLAARKKDDLSKLYPASSRAINTQQEISNIPPGYRVDLFNDTQNVVYEMLSLGGGRFYMIDDAHVGHIVNMGESPTLALLNVEGIKHASGDMLRLQVTEDISENYFVAGSGLSPAGGPTSSSPGAGRSLSSDVTTHTDGAGSESLPAGQFVNPNYPGTRQQGRAIPGSLGQEAYNKPLNGAVRKNPDDDGTWGRGTLSQFPDSLRKTNVDLTRGHIRLSTEEDIYRGVYTDTSVTPSKYYIKQDEHVFEVTLDPAGSPWKLDDSTPVSFNKDTGWEYPVGTELGGRGGFPFIRSKAAPDIELNGRIYKNHDAIKNQIDELDLIKKMNQYEMVSKVDPKHEQFSREFREGIRDYNNEEFLQYNSLSLREKIERLRSILPEHKLTYRQKGALWQKAYEQFWEDQARKQIITGQKWYDSARKKYNATGGEVSPQGAYLKDKKGECEPATILMAQAQRQGRPDELARSLMSLYDDSNNALGMSLHRLRGEAGIKGGIKGGVIKGVKLSELQNSERTLFPTSTTTSVRLELKEGETTMRNHVVLLSRRQGVSGNYIYSYFDPNYGYVEFSKYSDMAGFVKKRVQHKSKEKGGYGNSDNDVEFSEVSEQKLDLVTQDIPN